MWDAGKWRSVAESHLIITGTVVSVATAREIPAALAELARLAAPSGVLVAATGSDEWDVPEPTLIWGAGRRGCRLRSRAKLTAAEWGVLHSQEVEPLGFAAESSAAEGPADRDGRKVPSWRTELPQHASGRPPGPWGRCQRPAALPHE